MKLIYNGFREVFYVRSIESKPLYGKKYRAVRQQRRAPRRHREGRLRVLLARAHQNSEKLFMDAENAFRRGERTVHSHFQRFETRRYFSGRKLDHVL